MTTNDARPHEVTTSPTTTLVACPCGETQLAVEGPPLLSLYCHCQDCQMVHGAAYVGAAMYQFAQVRVVAGVPHIWVRKHTKRGSCPRCATRLYAEPPGEWVRSIVAPLLPAGVFQPTCHINCDSAVLPVCDRLPHYRGFPPDLGGSAEQVAW